MNLPLDPCQALLGFGWAAERMDKSQQLIRSQIQPQEFESLIPSEDYCGQLLPTSPCFERISKGIPVKIDVFLREVWGLVGAFLPADSSSVT